VALWIAAGANPKEVTVRAGHTSVAFTLDRYGHLFEGHDAELRDRLDAMHVEGLRSVAGGAVVELRTGPSRSARGPDAGPSKATNKHGPPS
jgi:hypothetical protein